VGVGVSAFESTGIYRLNGNRIPEYFSISDSGKTITYVATTRRNVAAVVVASASWTSSQNAWSISAEPSLSPSCLINSSLASPEIPSVLSKTKGSLAFH